MPRLVACSLLFSIPLAAQGWTDRTQLNGPTARADAAMCWDAAHGYVLMFGGSGYVGPFNDTWSWNGTAWTHRLTATTPYNNGFPASIAMTFHPPTGEVVMVSVGFIYTWNGNDWNSRGSVPIVNSNSYPMQVAMAHDPTRGQTVLFVGTRQNSPSSETYVWDGFNLSRRTPAVNPLPADRTSMAFDPVASKIVLCTNATNAGSGPCYFWEWNGTNWQQRYYPLAPAIGGPMATDVAHNRIVMLDGVMSAQPNHTWTLANGVSAQLSTPIEPARRTRAAMAFDAVRGCAVVFGGYNGMELADTWEFVLGSGPGYATFGAGCPGSRGVPSIAAQGPSLPRIGQTFTLQAGNLPWTGPVFLFLGLSNTSYGPTPLPFPMASIGAPGCSVLCSGEELHILQNVLGSAIWTFTVPNFPGLAFYNQAFAFDPGQNALGLTASNGGSGLIGF